MTAKYSDGSTRELADHEYTHTPDGALTVSENQIIVTHDGHTAVLPITVNVKTAPAPEPTPRPHPGRIPDRMAAVQRARRRIRLKQIRMAQAVTVPCRKQEHRILWRQ